MSTTTVSNGNGKRQSPAEAGAPAKAAGAIVLGALGVVIAIRRGFRSVTVKIGS